MTQFLEKFFENSNKISRFGLFSSLVFILICFSNTNFVSADLENDQINELNIIVVNLMKEKHFEESLEYIETILLLDPDNSNALINKGAALIQLEKFDEGIQNLEKVLDNDPDNISALKNVSVGYYSIGSCEKAIIYLDKILQLNPTSEILFSKGRCLDSIGLPNDAILLYDEALMKHDDWNVQFKKHVLLEKGNSLVKLERYNEAAKYYDKILQIDPDYKSALLNKVGLTNFHKDHDETAKILMKLLGPNLKRMSVCGSTGCMGDIPFLFPIKDSAKYFANVQLQIRNSSGDLVGIIESDVINYTPHAILNEILDSYEVDKEVERNGEIFEVRKITNQVGPENNQYLVGVPFLDRIEFFYNGFTVFFAYNMAIPIQQGDYIIAEWEIGKRVS